MIEAVSDDPEGVDVEAVTRWLEDRVDWSAQSSAGLIGRPASWGSRDRRYHTIDGI